MLVKQNQTYAAFWINVADSRYAIISVLEMPERIIYREDNDNGPTAYNRICSDCMDDTLFIYITSVVVIVLSFNGAIIGPVLAYIQDGSLVTLYEVRIPYFEDNPRNEFVVNIIWQNLFSVFLGVPGLFMLEGTVAIVTNAIVVSSKLTANEYDELSNELESGQIMGNQCERRLLKIFKQIIYMDR